jgi:transcriptional regulator with XRE-family HTH domain
MFDIRAQPTGPELQAFRLRITIKGQPCTQQQFADSIGTSLQNVKDYEIEKKGKLMPGPLWLIARITWDALALEQWKKTRPKRDDP